MHPCALLLLACLLPSASALAETSGNAVGVPETLRGERSSPERVEIRVAQGVAFHGDHSAYDYVLLPADVSVDGLGQAIDPQAVLKARADLQGTAYVFGSIDTDAARASASFTRNGIYGGYLGSGHLYAARIEQGRLRGRLKTQAIDAIGMLDATLDIPIHPRGKGTPLPADGGTPWREFLALRDALRSGKEGPIRARLGATALQQLPAGEPFEKILPGLLKNFPMKAVFVSGAMSPADAQLVLLDDSSGKPVRCIVTMLPEGAQWRMHRLSFRHGDKPIHPPAPPAAFTDVPVEDE